MDLIFYDIQYINWVKAAFVASLRAIFGSQYVPEQYKYIDDEEQTKILIYTAFPYRSFKSPCLVVDINSGSASVSYVGPQERIDRKIIKDFRLVLTKSSNNLDPLVVNNTKIRFQDIESIEITGYNINEDYTLISDNQGNAIINWINPPNEGILLEIFVQLKEGVPYLYFSGILRLRIKVDIYAQTVTDVEKLTDLLVVFLRFFLRDKLAELKITYTSINVSSISSAMWKDEILYKSTISIDNCHTEYELIFPESLLGYVQKINLTEQIEHILSEYQEVKVIL